MLLASAAPANAQLRDLGVRWRTIQTPNFTVHYHTPLGMVARHAADALERAHARLEPLMQHRVSSRVEVVLTDGTDSANGSADVLPYPAIRLFVTAPEDLSTLSDYDDWLLGLVMHEDTHIVHLDEIGGLPAILNHVFGRIYAPNQVQPRWFIEGYAVHEETLNTSGGRLRSSLYEMYMRQAALEDAIPGLDQLSTSIDGWPQGTAYYLYGAHFVRFIADRYGEGALNQIAHEYGRRAIPYGLNRAARHATGSSFVELYEAWRRHETEGASERADAIRAEGLREGRRLTDHGQVVRSPHFIGRHEIAYWVSDGHENSGIRQLDLSTDAGPEPVVRVAGEGGLGTAEDGQVLVYGGIGWLRNQYALDDLYRFDRRSGHSQRLTHGRRASEPDVSPDGRSVVFTLNSAGTRHLAIAELDDVEGSLRVLVRSRRFDQVYTPRFSPDGRTVVFSAWQRGGFRDIRLLHLDTMEVEELTHDRAQDTGPVFSADGQSVVFSSDRTGIANIYSLDLAMRTLSQLTNVIAGAYQPALSPDDQTLVYVGYGSRGFDLFAMPLAGAARPAPDYVDERPPPAASTQALALRSEGYNPWPTAMPQSWMLGLDAGAFGQELSATLHGGDVVGYFSYGARVGVDLDRGYVNATVSMRLTRSPLPLSLDLFRQVSPQGGLVVAGRGRRWIEDAKGARLGASYAFLQPFSSESLSLSYGMTNLHKLEPFGGRLDPNTPPPTVPSTGRLASLNAGFAYSDARQQALDYTASYGRTLGIGLNLADKSIGSEYRSLRLSWRFARYLSMPWATGHVLALHYAGGKSVGDLGHRGLFSVGGFPQVSLYDGFVNGVVVGGQALRGYPAYDRAGTSFQLLQAEYRFPIGRIERGYATLPFYLNRLWASAFVDYGDAYFGRMEMRRFRVGFGAEVFLDLTLGYFLPFTLRTGIAYGPNSGGGLHFYSEVGVPF